MVREFFFYFGLKVIVEVGVVLNIFLVRLFGGILFLLGGFGFGFFIWRMGIFMGGWFVF